MFVGVDHNPFTTETWRKSLTGEMRDVMQKGGGKFEAHGLDQRAWDWLVQRMHYLRGDYTDPETYGRLKALLTERNGGREAGGNALFYLATADRFFCGIIQQLGRAGLTEQTEGAWRRVIVEKPFGHDLPSARALNKGILKVLSEDQIYRIDHFLGKEPVQNIMVLRFANGIFEPLWRRDHIEHVQITVAETLGVEERGHLYERSGALRDMVPNHLFQLVAMIAMEPPTCFAANSVRAKKTELFEAIRTIAPEDAVRGRYGPGIELGRPVPGYREEEDVAPDSTVETFAALKLGIDNWRWAGVPFYLRTGKRMAGAVERNRDPVPASALCDVPRHPHRAPARQYHDPAYPAGRGAIGHIQRQTARPGDPDCWRGDELLLSQLFRAACRRGLRNAHLRLPAGRCDAVPKSRHRRGSLAPCAAAYRNMGERTCSKFSGLRRRNCRPGGGKQADRPRRPRMAARWAG